MFSGNAAGVCLLEEWLPDATLQAIAAENNLAETAFIIERPAHFDLRWLTPTVEVELCGHATLASAHVIFQHLGRAGSVVRFQSQGGELTVERKGNRLVLDFPSRPAGEVTTPEKLSEGLRAQPKTVLKGRDYLAVFETEREVAAIEPDFAIVAQLDAQEWSRPRRGRLRLRLPLFRAASGHPGRSGDRLHALHAHPILVVKRLGKRELFARQISARGGELFCEDRGDRVGIGGDALTYVEGKLHVE